MRVLVTGASGFVGGAVVRRLIAGGDAVVAAVRDPATAPQGVTVRAIGDMAGPVDWPRVVQGCDAVVHLAARVHVMRDTAADPEAAFAAANAEATRALAGAAVAAGVRRFVFMSSVKVLGEATVPGRPFRDASPPAPEDAYGRSKLAAEEALAGVPGLEPVVLRPPLVYGPGVRANLRALARLARLPLPLPFGGLDNRRSLVGVTNLAAAVALALVHPDAPGRRLLAADWHPTTAELVQALAAAAGRTAWLVPVPPAWFRAAAAIGAGAAVARLTRPLEVDPAGLRSLGWAPEQAPERELAALVRALG